MAAELEGKVAIITGAGSGIGRAAMRLFLEEGARVMGADRSQRRLEETGALLAAHGDRFALQACDAAEEEAVQALVAATVGRFGRLDIAFANAGVGGSLNGPDFIEVSDFVETMRVNAVGPLLLIKHAAPLMRAQKAGSIIVTASIAGQRGRSAGIDYSASKAAVLSIVQNAALSLARDGVRVNAVCPAGVETNMTRRAFEMLTAATGSNPIADINPMGRVGQPEDMAEAALFLASDRSAYINGQALNVCGGLSASHPFPASVPYQ